MIEINLAKEQRPGRPYGGWRRFSPTVWRLEVPRWGFDVDTLILQWTDHMGWVWHWSGFVGRHIGKNVTRQQAMRYAVDHVRDIVAADVDSLRRIGILLHPDD